MQGAYWGPLRGTVAAFTYLCFSAISRTKISAPPGRHFGCHSGHGGCHVGNFWGQVVHIGGQVGRFGCQLSGLSWHSRCAHLSHLQRRQTHLNERTPRPPSWAILGVILAMVGVILATLGGKLSTLGVKLAIWGVN